jgi:hypothetical protein
MAIEASTEQKEDWMNSKWRPMMGWSYMLTCIADFVIFPVLWSLLQMWSKGQVSTQWQPITLQGAGLYHIAMGAVLGIAAMGRTQEKLAGTNNGNSAASTVGTTTPGPTAPIGFSSPPAGAFTPAPSWGTTPVAGAPVSTPAATNIFTPDFTTATPSVVDTTANGKKIVPGFPEPLI